MPTSHEYVTTEPGVESVESADASMTSGIGSHRPTGRNNIEHEVAFGVLS